MKSKVTYIFFWFFIGSSFPVIAQQIVSLSGQVRDEQTKETLAFATIQLIDHDKVKYAAITDINGTYHLSEIIPGEYRIVISYLGYDKTDQKILITKKLTLPFYLKSSSTSLNEVVVTASESKGITSASKIDRTAMQHLQPTSFTDLLELLPGGKTTDPNMGKSNLIRMREAGSTSEAIASLGVGFVVDGMPVNTDANLQYIPETTKGDAKESVSKGVDMRTISTDNIESVEIVRGIPSVSYGNLTGGLVIIKRKNTETPFSARFKADQVSKLASIGKGIRLTNSGNDILNADLSYLDSKVDPRDSRENYKRLTASLRWNALRQVQRGGMEWNASVDYTGSFDNVKRDKDITIKEDKYKSSYDQFRLNGGWQWKPDQSFIKALRADVSLSQSFDRIEEVKSVAIDRPMAVPNSLEEGEADGIYLPYSYIANMVVDGKPLYARMKLSGDFGFKWGKSTHSLKSGIEWNYDKNLGDGRVYDLTRPLNPASINRPRKYSDIPAGERLSFYVEEGIKLPVGAHRFQLVAGVIGTNMLNLSEQFNMKGKVYIDPRFNLQWQLPALGANKDWFMEISAGIGWLSKMPTLAQMYPDMKYIDIVQLNYYHTNPDLRHINLMTYKWDNTNYALEPARNRKWEVRWSLAHKGNNFSVTYFEEKMNNAFRDMSYYRTLNYKKYEADMSYTPDTLINAYTKVGNGTRVRKQGVEFQFSSKRIDLLKTKITVNGAWFRTIYSTRDPQYKESSILLNGEQLKYIGLYDWEDGTEQQRFNTRFMFDTYLPKLGLIFSTTAECTWFTNSRNLWNDGVPVSYINKRGIVSEFTAADATDLQLQHLVKRYSSTYFNKETVPFAMDINLKATKKIGKYMDVSLFVNRILNVYPEYTRYDQLIRRTSSPYFGMEANLTF